MVEGNFTSTCVSGSRFDQVQIPDLLMGLDILGHSYIIFRFTDQPNQFFRVDENKYNYFSPVLSIFGKFMSDHKGFNINNKSGSKLCLG